ncbi:hypothetical protein IHE44_0005876 [Lamprotornis superbus]|uniref:Uncharacterized protein n=1 Tax=Lamprotornis superbus TaxID=245042 RepID=A0A835NVW6_9PASS|nr:hypothetical protein IHE44_0005876 [Lamprotornis superbus]
MAEVSLREICGLTVNRWSNHQQNDSWWQILWTRFLQPTEEVKRHSFVHREQQDRKGSNESKRPPPNM